ncbi:hypothetical protein QPK32_25070 [Massilia sp. YIM B02763]|uniref:hypothetical protein n=1 Tax=Massilia sp. YIM B02763 TaxID=3050130 RepID=UPI0025B6A970|nr:hypothetical protein [Massilia sp. YIM B02763]MDN4056343.1 hypothetical protein [Massilia sp. YIM B02763]
MANLKAGYLGGAELDGANEVILYEVQAPAIAATFTVSFCNKGQAPAAVFLAHGTGATSAIPGARFWEHNAVVEPGTPLERTALVLNAGRKLFAWSTSPLVDVSVHGFEKG